MKLLFTSVGRRVELIQSFKTTAKDMNVDLHIIGADMVDTAPALYFCDDIKIVPRISSDNYIDSLLSICKEENVDAIIPTIDTELLKLSKHKAEFEELGVKVFISDYDKIKICRDKRYTYEYFTSIGLNSPKTFDDVENYNCGFPAFIKPKDGSSSINAYKVDNMEDLKLYASKIENYIIQPFISGKEYTVDIFCDYCGNPVFITPRERIAVRSGEVLKTRICQNDVIIEEMKNLVKDFKPVGQIAVQLIQDEFTKENYYIEINPRFGGGSPLSMKAGANSAEAMIKILNGESLCYVPYSARDNEIYSRYDQSVCVKAGVKRD